jgi:peptide deformylase
MLKIEIWNENTILRTVSSIIYTIELNTYIKLGREMIKYIKNPDNIWVWLAAPQIWYNKRLIVVSLLKDREDKKFSTIMMINPEIIEKSKEMYIENEWCLSVPWKKWPVERYTSLKIQFINENKKNQTLILQGISARIVQHEIDHLDGILFIDKIVKK